MGRRVAVVMRSRRVTRRGVMLGGKEGEEGVGMGGAEGSSSIAGAIFTFFFLSFLVFSARTVSPYCFFSFSFFSFSRGNVSCFSFRQAFYSSGFPRLFCLSPGDSRRHRPWEWGRGCVYQIEVSYGDIFLPSHSLIFYILELFKRVSSKRRERKKEYAKVKGKSDLDQRARFLAMIHAEHA